MYCLDGLSIFDISLNQYLIFNKTVSPTSKYLVLLALPFFLVRLFPTSDFLSRSIVERIVVALSFYPFLWLSHTRCTLCIYQIKGSAYCVGVRKFPRFCKTYKIAAVLVND